MSILCNLWKLFYVNKFLNLYVLYNLIVASGALVFGYIALYSKVTFPKFINIYNNFGYDFLTKDLKVTDPKYSNRELYHLIDKVIDDKKCQKYTREHAHIIKKINGMKFLSKNKGLLCLSMLGNFFSLAATLLSLNNYSPFFYYVQIVYKIVGAIATISSVIVSCVLSYKINKVETKLIKIDK